MMRMNLLEVVIFYYIFILGLGAFRRKWEGGGVWGGGLFFPLAFCFLWFSFGFFPPVLVLFPFFFRLLSVISVLLHVTH